MREGNVAIIGDKDSVLCFRAAGVDVFPVVTEDEAHDSLKKCARTYKIIFLTEQFAVKEAELITRYKTRAYPIVIPVPSVMGSLGVGMDGIKKDVEKAIGTDILFNKEEK